MDKLQMINHIKQTAARVLPKGSTLYLYGSRARGDYHEDSDWDLLLLIDKPKLDYEDFDKYSYPFVTMGWDLGEDIRPHAYTKDEWFNGPHAMFYYNVEEDKEVLYARTNMRSKEGSYGGAFEGMRKWLPDGTKERKTGSRVRYG